MSFFFFFQFLTFQDFTTIYAYNCVVYMSIHRIEVKMFSRWQICKMCKMPCSTIVTPRAPKSRLEMLGTEMRLEQVYLQPFEACVREAGVEAIMCLG